jgi:hypothetical protein
LDLIFLSEIQSDWDLSVKILMIAKELILRHPIDEIQAPMRELLEFLGGCHKCVRKYLALMRQLLEFLGGCHKCVRKYNKFRADARAVGISGRVS